MGRRLKKTWKLLKRLTKWCVIIGVALFVLVVVLLVGVRLYLTDARLTKLARDQLSSSLGEDVALKKVELRLRRGIRVEKLVIGKQDAGGPPPLLSLGKFVFGYQLSSVFPPKLTIGSIEIASPHIYIAAKPEKDDRTFPWSTEFAARLLHQLIPLPGAVSDVAEALTLVPRLVLPIGPSEKAETAEPEPEEGEAAQSAGSLEGLLKHLPAVEFELKQFSITDPLLVMGAVDGTTKRIRGPDINVAIKTKLSPSEQRFDLERFGVAIGKGSALEMVCSVSEFLGKQKVAVDLRRCSFDLGELFAVAKPLVEGVDLSGKLDVPVLSVAGDVAGATPLAATVTVQLLDVSASYAIPKQGTRESSAARIKDLDVSVAVENTQLVELFPDRVRTRLKVGLGSASYGQISIQNLTGEILITLADMAKKGDEIRIGKTSVSSALDIASLSMREKGLEAEVSGFGVHIGVDVGSFVQDPQGLRVNRSGLAATVTTAAADVRLAAATVTAHVEGLGVTTGVQVDDLELAGKNIRIAQTEVTQGFSTQAVTATVSARSVTVGPVKQQLALRTEDVGVKGEAKTHTVGAVSLSAGLDVGSLALADGKLEAGSAGIAATVTASTQNVTQSPAEVGADQTKTHLAAKLGASKFRMQDTAASAGPVCVSVDTKLERFRQAEGGIHVDKLGLTQTLRTKPINAEVEGKSISVGPLDEDLEVAVSSVRLRSDTSTVGPASLDLTANLGPLEVSSDDLRASVGSLDQRIRIDAKGELDGQYQPDPIDASLGLKTRIGRVACRHTVPGKADAGDEASEDESSTITEAELGSLSVDVDVSSGYAMPGTLRPSDIRCEVRMRDLAAKQETHDQVSEEGPEEEDNSRRGVAAEIGSVDLRLRAAVPEAVSLAPAPGATTTTAMPAIVANAAVDALSVGKAVFRTGDIETLPTDLAVTLTAHADTGKQEYTLKGLRATVGNMLGLNASARLEQQASRFDAKLSQHLDLGRAVAQIPAAIQRDLPTIKTDLVQHLTLTATGRVPEPKEIESLRLPIDLTTGLTLRGDVELPDRDIVVRGIDQTLGLRVGTVEGAKHDRRRGNVVVLEERLTVASVSHPSIPQSIALSPTLDLDIELTDFDRLSTSLRSQMTKGLDLDFTARADGLRTFVEQKGMKSLHDVFDRTNGELSVQLKAEDLHTLSHDDLKTAGGLSLDLTAGLAARRSVFAQFHLLSDALGVAMGDSFQVDRVDADVKLDVRKSVEVLNTFGIDHDRGDENLSESFLGKVESLLAARNRKSTHDLYDDLRTYSNRPESLRIKRVKSGDYEVNDFTLDLSFDRGFWIDHISLSVLGGAVTGRVGAGRLDDTYVLALSFDFTGLNGHSLLPGIIDASVPEEDGEISGNLMVAVRLDAEEQLGLDDVEMAVNITKVGRKAVDGFLRAQDPYESDPNIVSVRKYVALGGRPLRVSVRISNGEMRQQIRWGLPGGAAFNLPLPESVPLGRIMDLSMFDAALNALTQVQKALEMLAATKIRVDRSGALRFAD